MGDAPSSGPAVYRDETDYETSQSFILNAGTLLNDRWQVGVRVPWVWTESGASRLGDLGATVGYELISETRYKQVPTKAFTYIIGQVPTGASIFENTGSSAQVTGTGYYSLGTGLTFQQRLGLRLDLLANGEMRKPLPRFERDPGLEFSGSLGLGFMAIKNFFRIGARLTPNLRSGSETVDGSLVWDSAFEASLFLGLHTMRAAYVDQTLMGPAYNTTLNRSFLLTYQFSWER